MAAPLSPGSDQAQAREPALSLGPESISETTIGVVIAAVFGLIGAALIVLGVYVHHLRASLVGEGIAATGVVVGFERVGGAGGGTAESFLVPRVRFTTTDAKEVTFLGSTAAPAWFAYPPVGGSVAVVYDPARPEDARIDSFAEIWFAPLMLWLIGGGAIVIPALALWRHARG